MSFVHKYFVLFLDSFCNLPANLFTLLVGFIIENIIKEIHCFYIVHLNFKNMSVNTYLYYNSKYDYVV